MKYVFAAFLFALFLLILVLDRVKDFYVLHIASDPVKSENLRLTMETSTECFERIQKAENSKQIREKKSSCPTPNKPRQLLSDFPKMILNAIVGAIVNTTISELIKNLLKRFLG